MESLPLALRFLIALPFYLAAGCVFSYFSKPEDFFIKRFRPPEEVAITHSQLLFRAFLGPMLSVPIIMLGAAIITSDSAILERAGSWITIGLVFGLFLGVSSYVYFRLWRYRELTPAERHTFVGSGGVAFVRRESPNQGTWLLRAGLIVLFAFMAVTGIPLLLLMLWSLGLA